MRKLAIALSVVGSIAALSVASVGAAGAAETQAPVAGAFAQLESEAITRGTTRAIVELKANPSDGVANRSQANGVQQDLGNGGRIVRTVDNTNLAAVNVSATGLAALRRSSHVKQVLPDDLVAPQLTQTVALTGAQTAWIGGFDGTGQVVAVLDTGIDRTHPFLKDKVIDEACFSSGYTGTGGCPNNQTTQTGAGAAAPCKAAGCEHGTHVAGISAGRSGVQGAPTAGIARGARVLAVQVFSVFPAGWGGCFTACPLAYTSDIIAALNYVKDRKLALPIAAANLSLGGGSSATKCGKTAYEKPIAGLKSAGVAVVIASGNEANSNGISYPACSPSAISVGATNKQDQVETWYSNVSPYLTLLAPGSSVVSSIPGGGYAAMTGTSMATPHAAGAYAILRQRFGASLSVDQLTAKLTSTGKKITDRRNGTAYPRIDLAKATGVPATKAKTAGK
ncbi:MAG: S8 family peptidase [Acidimicrobiia bacterium]